VPSTASATSSSYRRNTGSGDDIEEGSVYQSSVAGPNFALTTNLIGDAFVVETPVLAVNQYLITDYTSKFAPLNFGFVPVGTSTTLPLAVTNTGNRTLSFKPYYVSPSYKILSATPSGCEAGTAPGNTCTLNIQFTALSAGNHTIELTLGGNAAEDKVILLQGFGTK
jgi:hypothetical protein